VIGEQEAQRTLRLFCLVKPANHGLPFTDHEFSGKWRH